MMDWSQMSKLVEEMWSDHLVCVDVDEKYQLKKEIKDIAPQAAYSFWNLNNWENFKKYVKCLDPQLHPYDRYFYQAVLEIKNGKEKLARENIDKARENLDAKVTTMISESYNRAYSLIQELQFLKELEEVIEYKKSSTSEKKKETLYKSWCQRMKAIPNNDLEA
jgi:FKBP12-rapamycin complex-associated protein